MVVLLLSGAGLIKYYFLTMQITQELLTNIKKTNVGRTSVRQSNKNGALNYPQQLSISLIMSEAHWHILL